MLDAAAVPETAATRALQTVVLLGLFSLIFLPEYAQGAGEPSLKSSLYAQAIGGVRWIDLLVLSAFAVHSAMLSCLAERRLPLPKAPIRWFSVFGGAVLISMIYGAMHGGENLFFDWRAIVLGTGVYTVYAAWLRHADACADAAYLFIAYCLLRTALFAVQYLAGGGTELLGRRIPVFDGPTLSTLVCASLLSFAMGAVTPGGRGWLFLASGLALSTFVLLCFRRTYWAELAIGATLLVVFSNKRWQMLGLLAFSLLVAFAALGPAAIDRARSLDFTDSESQFGGDNADHVGDLVDAWQQVKASPLMGVGLGRPYPTWEIRHWKDESVMVHNAPLHVWLKYGAFGLVCYVGFHLSLFRALNRRRRHARGSQSAITAAVLAYLVSQFAVSLGFTPWPYSAVQSTNLAGFLLAIAFSNKSVCPFQQFPSSRPRITPANSLKMPC